MNSFICHLFNDAVTGPTSYFIASSDKMIRECRQLIGKDVERSGRDIN
jgi:hypothetical protein